MNLSETTPNADVQPSHRSQTRPQRQAGRTCTATFYVDSDVEGRHPVIVQFDRSWSVSSLLIAESDRPIVLKSFYETDDRGSLPSRIDKGRAVQLVYQRVLFSWAM